MTKTFTATVLARMVLTGGVSLSDPVAEVSSDIDSRSVQGWQADYAPESRDAAFGPSAPTQ